MLLVLDFQPGATPFLNQVKAYEKFLLQPEVGVALDPEWKLHRASGRCARSAHRRRRRSTTSRATWRA